MVRLHGDMVACFSQHVQLLLWQSVAVHGEAGCRVVVEHRFHTAPLTPAQGGGGAQHQVEGQAALTLHRRQLGEGKEAKLLCSVPQWLVLTNGIPQGAPQPHLEAKVGIGWGVVPGEVLQPLGSLCNRLCEEAEGVEHWSESSSAGRALATRSPPDTRMVYEYDWSTHGHAWQSSVDALSDDKFC